LVNLPFLPHSDVPSSTGPAGLAAISSLKLDGERTPPGETLHMFVEICLSYRSPSMVSPSTPELNVIEPRFNSSSPHSHFFLITWLPDHLVPYTLITQSPVYFRIIFYPLKISLPLWCSFLRGFLFFHQAKRFLPRLVSMVFLSSCLSFYSFPSFPSTPFFSFVSFAYSFSYTADI
jgi:hypothetical protein